MTAKDSALFEGRTHNFNVLLSSDDEEAAVRPGKTSSPADEKAAVGGASMAPISGAPSANDDGFETFSTARKQKSHVRTGEAHPNKPLAPRTTPVKPSTGFPREVIRPTPETSIELCDFPATLRTGDLRKFLQAFEGSYRLKWHNDTSCYVVFDDVSCGTCKD